MLSIKYEDILARPRDVIAKLSTFLSLTIPERTIEECVRRFDKENVKALISKTDEDIEKRIKMGQHIAQEEVVVIGPENKRSFDLKTGFQTGHVSDYRDGDWCGILTLEQKRTLDREVGMARAAWRQASGATRSGAAQISVGYQPQSCECHRADDP